MCHWAIPVLSSRISRSGRASGASRLGKVRVRENERSHLIIITRVSLICAHVNLYVEPLLLQARSQKRKRPRAGTRSRGSRSRSRPAVPAAPSHRTWSQRALRPTGHVPSPLRKRSPAPCRGWSRHLSPLQDLVVCGGLLCLGLTTQTVRRLPAGRSSLRREGHERSGVQQRSRDA